MTSSGYLRYPHIHGDLVTFTAEDDVWLAPAAGGRAWKLSADGASVSYPRFSPGGEKVAWTSWRDRDPELYTIDAEGGPATRLTYWGDAQTRTAGWVSDSEVLAISAVGQPARQYSWAYAVPLDGPPHRLPYGPVADLALGSGGGDASGGKNAPAAPEPAAAGPETPETPPFDPRSAIVDVTDGRFADYNPVFTLDGLYLAFLADHEGTGNVYSCALDGSDLRRHSDHDRFYARNATTDGQRIVYHVAGDIWILDSLDDAGPRKLDIILGSASAARSPRIITAADHLGEFMPDATGQASVVEVRGTVHWLTHADGHARALSVDPKSRARDPRILGTDGKVIWVTDADGEDALEIADASGESAGTRQIASGELGYVANLAPSPDGAHVAVTAHDGRLLIVTVETGEVLELAESDDGLIWGLSWSPDSAWLAWSQPGPRPLARIRVARITPEEPESGEDEGGEDEGGEAAESEEPAVAATPEAASDAAATDGVSAETSPGDGSPGSATPAAPPAPQREAATAVADDSSAGADAGGAESAAARRPRARRRRPGDPGDSSI